MDISARHRDVRSRFLTLIEGAGVAPPNAIEYDAGSVTFYWYEPKLAVIVDLDDGDAPIAR
jgi:hypothetical protein